MNEIDVQKQILREKYICIRNNISDKSNKSQSIINKIIETEEFKNSKIIAVYKNLNSEVNTNNLIEYSINIGKTIVLPRIINNNLAFYKLNSHNDILVKNNFGIQEPLGLKNNLVENNRIDLIIVPGVCFDTEKNRLGFGKGFYDRFLENLNIKAFGICFDEQILLDGILPITNNDVKMTKVITDKKIYE